jgi:hypoxanthine phosphoribosyltransferase
MQYIPQSKYRPDYFAEEVIVWKWFIYPWNWIEDTSTLIVRLMGTQKGKKWVVYKID